MPVKRGIDAIGPYYAYGDSGKHYHYQPGNESSRKTAQTKAKKQGQAIKAHQNRKK